MNKLKRIEIKAFRVYNENQVFDFTYKDNDIANLVVIYGPNGFGKTSFSDAVEWGLTSQIDRICNNDIVMETVNYEKGKILKNRDSKEERGTIVFVADDNSKLHRYTKVIDGRTKKDYQPGDSEFSGDVFRAILNSDFGSKNILAHEQIDSFLKAVSPEERYNELKAFWDGDNEANIYNDINAVCKESEKQLTMICSKKEDLEKAISSSKYTSEELVNINLLIQKLNLYLKNKLNIITESTTSKDLTKLIEMLVRLRTVLDQKEKFHSDNKNLLKTLLEKNSLYLSHYAKYEKDTEELKSIEETLLKFNIVENNSKLIEEKEDVIKQSSYQRGKYEGLVNNNSEYNTIKSQIIKLQDFNIGIRKGLYDLQEYKKNLEVRHLNNNEYLYRENQQLLLVKEFESNINDHIKQYLYITAKNNHYTARVGIIKSILSIRKDRVLILKKKRDVYANCLLSNKEVIFEQSNIYEVHDEVFSECIRMYNDVKKLEVDIQKLEHEYFEFGKLNEELNQITKVGEKYIEKTETSVCPLCNNDYKKHEILLINVHKHLNNLFELSLIKEKLEDLQLKKKNLLTELSCSYELFIKLIKDDVKEIDKNIERENNKLFIMEALESSLKNKCFIFNSQIEELIKIFEENDLKEFLISKDLDGMSAIICRKKDFINSKVIEAENEKQIIEIEINKNNQVIIGENSKLSKNGIEIDMLKSTPVYVTYEEDLKELHVENNFEVIKNNFLNLTIIISFNRKCIDDLIKLNNTLGLELQGIEKNLAQDRKARIVIQTDITKKIIEDYEGIYQKATNEFISKISDKIIKQNLEKLEEKLCEIEEIKGIVLNLINYNEVIDEKIKLSEKIQELKKVENDQLIMQEAHEQLKGIEKHCIDYIIQKINNAFNSKVINEIYSRIEPHPNLTEIEFEPDFSDNKPKIHIYTKGDSTEKTSPILFLSSAQLNMLSLSIFYARALQNCNSKLKTVFMDDPVEHLDDINILSFIDLIRTIIVELDMQIIMSTHDENLFNLLKRKIDPQYYKSRFIELESYGKVKVDENFE